MSIRSRSHAPAESFAAQIEAANASTENTLGEGASFVTQKADNPLSRHLHIAIRSTLRDLCLQTSKATWAPSSSALKQIFQQRKFTSLDGDAEAQGELDSVVLHKLSMPAAKNTFPCSVGVKISAVDDNTFSGTGDAYAVIMGAESERVAHGDAAILQQDDVKLAYEFSSRFPGYTNRNLDTKGVHSVPSRKFYLVNSTHPVIAAISENSTKLQMGEITMMPEGLVKIGQPLYESILPLVKAQVDNQIKVRDFSRTSVSLAPAEHSSWDAVRAQLVGERLAGDRARLEANIGGAADDAEVASLRTAFDKQQRRVENEVESQPFEFSATLSIDYNFLSSGDEKS